MSDTIDAFRDMKELRKLERQRFGVPCPECQRRLPRAHPKILQPGQTCRAHKPHYRDNRPQPSDAEWSQRMAGTGWATGGQGT